MENSTLRQNCYQYRYESNTLTESNGFSYEPVSRAAFSQWRKDGIIAAGGMSGTSNLIQIIGRDKMTWNMELRAYGSCMVNLFGDTYILMGGTSEYNMDILDSTFIFTPFLNGTIEFQLLRFQRNIFYFL